jgi:hypothetical protein
MKLLALGILLGYFLALLISATAGGRGHNRPGPHNVTHAIRDSFGRFSGQAIRVFRCESDLDPEARNGQYRGIAQMGSSERRRLGHGRDPWTQARAAFRYFRLAAKNGGSLSAGWAPWTYCGRFA